MARGVELLHAGIVNRTSAREKGGTACVLTSIARASDRAPTLVPRSALVNRPLKIGILQGDDIGLEVVPETIKVMRAAAERCALAVEWRPLPIGRKAYDELGYTLPPGTLEKLDTLDGWVLGPIGHQAYPKGVPNAINPHPILRKHYDLFANI